jgi:hypothetical protein
MVIRHHVNVMVRDSHGLSEWRLPGCVVKTYIYFWQTPVDSILVLTVNELL